MNVKAIKMHGQGNDYIFLDLEEKKHNLTDKELKKLAIKLSNRNFGIGSDGLVLIEKIDIKEDFYHADLRIFNADGSEAETCGTALRCAAWYLSKKRRKSHICLHTLSGKRLCSIAGRQKVTVDMGKVSFEKELTLKIDKQKIYGFVLDVGNPHYCIFDPSPLSLAPSTFPLWRTVSTHQKFPEQTNIELISLIADDEISVKVYERGSGFTLACGSGACASAFISHKMKDMHHSIKVNLPGGNVHVDIEPDDSCFLTGKVEKVFETNIEV